MTGAMERHALETMPRASVWMGAAFLAALALATATLAASGVERTGVETALRLTARLGFLFFWPSYAGGALARLFGETWRPLKRRVRVLGMAFSAVLAVHLSLVALLCWIGSAPPAETFAIFGVGAVCAYVMLLGSIDRVRRTLGETSWRAVQTVGANYILFAFAFDFLGHPPRASIAYLAAYLPFVTLAVLGPVLRLLAWLKPRGETLRASRPGRMDLSGP
jgi:hypothetical protein